MAPNTTPIEKAKIYTMKHAGYSNKEIQAALPGRHNFSDRQIKQIFNRFGEKENYYDVGHSTGRPRKLTEQDGRAAVCLLGTGQACNATDLQENHFPEVHVDTVKREL
ncbi:hypothetical protein BKA70DRAFT_1129330, partial [Coprinopsis sp. MPI-PUGE-AT-0042]